jgi:hypothetical protein
MVAGTGRPLDAKEMKALRSGARMNQGVNMYMPVSEKVPAVFFIA